MTGVSALALTVPICPLTWIGQRRGAEAGQRRGDGRRGQDGQQQADGQQPGRPHPPQHERHAGAAHPLTRSCPGGRAVHVLAQAPAHAADGTQPGPGCQVLGGNGYLFGA